MPLYGAANVLDVTHLFKVCWIKGRYGGGKTILAWRLAYELYRQGKIRHIVSNCRSVWADSPLDIQVAEGRYLDTAIILDEGGLFLRTGRDIDPLLAFMRKFNVILLIPSVKPPASGVRFFSIQRMYNFAGIGLPLWWYRATLRYDDQRETYNFAWWQPAEMFGIYDTSDTPVDDNGLSDWLVNHMNGVIEANGQGKQARAKRLGGEAVGASFLDGGGGDATSESLMEAASQIGNVVSVLEAVGNQKRRRRN